MRISDWGAEVCSSDLRIALAKVPAFAGASPALWGKAGPGLLSPATGLDGAVPRCAAAAPPPSNPAAPLSRRRSWASVFRPLAWPSPDRRFEGSKDDDQPNPDKLAQCKTEEHTSELTSLKRISYADICLY